MNRRGYVFTILALLVIAIVFGVLALSEEYAARSSGLHGHLLSADNFLGQFEEDLPRAVRIISYRSLLGLDEHVSRTGEYVDDFSSAFSSMAMNGSVDGFFYDVMEDGTLDVFEQRMQELAGRVGLVLDLRIVNASIEHTGPFTVRTESEVEVFLQTRDASTSWNYSKNFSSEFSITDLRDPLYTVETAGRVPVAVREVNVSRPFITSDNDTTRLQVVFNESLYVANEQAPSFLMRFSGNVSASEHGISSLVDVRVLDAQDVAVQTDRSAVDFLYFGSSATSTNTIVNMPETLLIDDDHLSLYDAQEATT